MNDNLDEENSIPLADAAQNENNDDAPAVIPDVALVPPPAAAAAATAAAAAANAATTAATAAAAVPANQDDPGLAEDKSYHTINRDAFYKSMQLVLDVCDDKAIPDDVPNKEMFLTFVDKVIHLADLVFGMFDNPDTAVATPTMHSGEDVADGKMYFVYLSQDPAHGWTANGKTACEAWMMLSAICMGNFAGPALRPDDEKLDGYLFSPIWYRAMEERDFLMPTLIELTSQHLVNRRNTEGKDKVNRLDVDVKFHSLGNSLKTIVDNVYKTVETVKVTDEGKCHKIIDPDNDEIILACAVFKHYAEDFLYNDMKSRIVWCYPIHYDWLKDNALGTISADGLELFLRL